MLAIIIPYYKFTFFEETLKSLAGQTDKRFKVYIGDDASFENPIELLNRFQKKFDFVYHRFENNLGGISLVKQWERCIDLSTSEEWLIILGDDDYLDETVVASWYANFDKFHQKSEVIRFSSKLVNEEIKTISDVFIHPIWESATESFYRKFINLSRSSLSEYVFSRKTYLKYGFYNYPLAWFSDDRAWLDFSDNKPILSINDSIIYARNSFLNISNSNDNLDLKNNAEIEFYNFLISKKIKCYNKQQRLKIIRKYETVICVTRKPTFKEYVLLFYYYLMNFEYLIFQKFIKRHVKIILSYD